MSRYLFVVVGQDMLEALRGQVLGDGGVNLGTEGLEESYVVEEDGEIYLGAVEIFNSDLNPVRGSEGGGFDCDRFGGRASGAYHVRTPLIQFRV